MLSGGYIGEGWYVASPAIGPRGDDVTAGYRYAVVAVSYGPLNGALKGQLPLLRLLRRPALRLRSKDRLHLDPHVGRISSIDTQ